MLQATSFSAPRQHSPAPPAAGAGADTGPLSHRRSATGSAWRLALARAPRHQVRHFPCVVWSRTAHWFGIHILIPPRLPLYTTAHDALGPDEMRPLMDALGITLDSTVVLTDPFGLMPSARLWWLLKAYGLRDVWVLPGGHRGVEGLAPPAPPTAALKVARDLAATREAAAPLPGPTELYWSSSDWARLAGGAPEGSQVLDVRSVAEFEGVDLRGNPVGGHIPGALCVPHTEFCDMTPGDGGAPTLRPAEEVLALLGEAGLAPPGNAPPIITVCQSGMRSVRGGGRCCIPRCSGLHHPLSSPPLSQSLATLVLTSLGYSVRNYEAGMGHFLSRPAP